jgi:hypothetical protein
MLNIVQKWIQKNINDYLLTITKPEGIVLPSGFNPAENIRHTAKQWVMLPFGAGVVCVQLRVLSAGEMPQLSVIETAAKAASKSREDMIRLLNIQEDICRKALLSPTFEQMEKEILKGDHIASEQRRKFKEAKEKLAQVKDENEKLKLKQRLDALELAVGYFLPDNFMSAVSAWALCLDATDVKRVTPDRLIEAYRLSQLYHNRASDNLQGVFCDYQRREIDITAAYLASEEDKKNRKPKKILRKASYSLN